MDVVYIGKGRISRVEYRHLSDSKELRYRHLVDSEDPDSKESRYLENMVTLLIGVT